MENRVSLVFLLKAAVTFCCIGASMSAQVSAQGFGIFDAKGLAQGGAVVALANADQAHFYNPALLAFHDGIEEKTNDGRVSIPILTAQIPSATVELVELNDDALDQDLSNAISAFNANNTQLAASSAQSAAQNLLNTVNTIGNDTIDVDSFLGISVSEPSDRQGGAFYVGIRALGGAVPDIPIEDIALLEDYVEALEFIATDGASGTENPELFAADGSLIDLTDTFTSSVEARVVTITEFGVSFAKEFRIFGHPVAFGATPKFMIIDSFDEIASIDDSVEEEDSSGEGRRAFNVDFGIATEVVKNLRVAFSAKDIISQRFDAANGDDVEIQPRARLGVAYQYKGLKLGLDYDLDVIDPVAFETPVQELAFGGELRVAKPIYLRWGYRRDLENNREDILSGGLGFFWSSFLLDLSFAAGEDTQGLGVQLSYAF